jgi:ABC-type sugar transport system ATPase subunit
MAFSLKYRRGSSKAEIGRRVAEAARILELEPLLERKPAAAVGRSAAAGGDGPGDRAAAPGVS